MNQASQRLRVVTATCHHDTQIRKGSCLSLVPPFTRYLSKGSPEVYKIDQFYIGHLKEMPPPASLQQEWDDNFRLHLEEHLCQATMKLPKSMRDEEVITEVVLCMAGKRCQPSTVPSEPGAACPEDPVALNPTIWIFCGSRKCQKRIVKVLSKLTYLDSFLNKHCMETPHTSLHAPWPAAEQRPPQLQDHVNDLTLSLAIGNTHFIHNSMCGAEARFTIQTQDNILECYSTIGGLVMANGCLFALTTAHAIINGLRKSNLSIAANEVSSTSSVCDSDSSHESSSDEGLDVSADTSVASNTSKQVSSPTAPTTTQTIEGQWNELPLPRIMAYINHGTTIGDYSFPQQAPTMSDFALMDLKSVTAQSNQYFDPDHNVHVAISDHLPEHELLDGHVLICGRKPIRGYMLKGDASVILRGAVIRTKKVQVKIADGMLR